MQKIFFTLLIAITGLTALAQEEVPQRGFDKSRFFFGGNFGLSFGNYTFVNVSPQVGYRFANWFAAGAGPNFQYTSYKNRINGNTVSRENYGVLGLNAFGRLYPIDQVFIQVQPEGNYTWGKYKFYGPPEYTSDLKGKIVPSLLLGAGGAIPAGRGAFIVMAQYDVLQNERTPYGNKVFYNFGYNVGF